MEEWKRESIIFWQKEEARFHKLSREVLEVYQGADHLAYAVFFQEEARYAHMRAELLWRTEW